MMNAADEGSPFFGDEDMRSLAQLYGELARLLLHVGYERSAEGQKKEAEERFVEAVQASERALREGGDKRLLGVLLARAQEARERFEDAVRAYLNVVLSEPSCAPEILPKVHRLLSAALAQSMGCWIDSEWRPAMLRASVSAEAAAAIRGAASSASGQLWHRGR